MFYINSEELRAKMTEYGWQHPDSTVSEFVDDLTPADVRENIHGEWMPILNCSKCKSFNNRKTNFCPNCGADMRKKVEQNETNN